MSPVSPVFYVQIFIQCETKTTTTTFFCIFGLGTYLIETLFDESEKTMYVEGCVCL